MRLLDTSAVQLHDFFGAETPNYAILSHRWGDGEISYKDVTESRNLQASGWVKVRKSCEVAKSCGYDWIWIDTCCIDKSSSTELGEAINSMFNWYRDAEICLAYLGDVRKEPDVSSLFKIEKSQEHSIWFRRGWTLQELLAPREIRFYDKSWNHLGTKSELVSELQSITGIDAEYLCGGNAFRRACIATRMSWMANRTTLRKEDLAYSMLGIFNINMTPRYGEGELAFVRLQQILLANSLDESLFAWRMTTDDVGGTTGNWSLEGWDRDEWGLLAPHPSCFKDSQRLTIRGPTIPRPLGSFSMTQEGIQVPMTSLVFKRRFALPAYIPFVVLIWLPLFYLATQRANRKGERRNAFTLNCWQRDELGNLVRVQLYLRPCAKGSVVFKRCRCTEFMPHDKIRFKRYARLGLTTYLVLQPQRA